jgi:NitT/TauT family transport system ATP-binding protein
MGTQSPLLRVSDLTFRYRQRGDTHVLRDLNFTVDSGEFVTIVGPSGAGKSTLLNIIAGISKPQQGTMRFETAARVGYQFQQDAIFPWRTVERNLTYADEIRGASNLTQKQRAVELCQMVGLAPEVFLSRLPRELSGGELRRIGLAMAISTRPNLLLLDEATGNLDSFTKRTIHTLLQQLLISLRLTVISVTHDVDEAIFLSDRIFVLRHQTLALEIAVNIHRPRTHDVRFTKEFADLEEAVMNSISEL